MQENFAGMNLLDVVTAKNLKEIARTVNRVEEIDNIIKAGDTKRTSTAGTIRVTCESAIPQFSVVSLVSAVGISGDDSFSAEEATRPVMKCEPWSEENENLPWGVLVEALEASGIGRVILSGVTICKITYSTGDEYVEPSDDGLVSTSDVTSTKILWTEGTEGVVFAVIQLGGARLQSAAVPCKIISGSSLEGYSVELYANGISASSTGTGTLHILEISGINYIQSGSFVMGWPSEQISTGGNE